MLVGPFWASLIFALLLLANKVDALAEWLPDDEDALSLFQFSLLQNRISNGSSRTTEGKGLTSQRFESNLWNSLESLPSEFRKTGARQGVAPVGSEGHLISNIQTGSSTNRAFEITCCVVAVIAMLGLRVLERLVEFRHLGTLIMLADVIAWYVITSVYLAACQELLTLSSGPATIIISMIQVSSGLVILPFGDVSNLNKLSGHYFMILAGCGSVFYFSSFFVLEGLSHAGIILVSNIRALEPISTTLIMVMFGGECLSRLQYLSILLAVFGVIVAGNNLGKTNFNGFVMVMLLLWSNVLYSLRNILIQQASELGFAFKSKMTVFVICCSMALPLGGIMLVLGHFANLPHMMISSVFVDPWLLAISSLSFTLYNVASFLVLMRVKPVMHVVLLAGKRVVSVLLACALSHHLPSSAEVLGMCITIISVAAFEVERRKSSLLNNAAERATEVHREKQGDGKLDLADKATVAKAAKTEAGSMIKQLLLSRMKFTIILSLLTVACISMALYSCSS